MKMSLLGWSAVFALGTAAAFAAEPAAPQPAAPAAAAPAAAPAAAAPAATPAAAAPAATAPLLHLTGFQTPEGVVFDEANDRYLVGNINGKPLDKDNNGYITVVSPDGKIVTEKWIAGGVGKVTLHAPKGMALDKGTLYVADIDVLRMFDAKTGKPTGEVAIKGASFLNDVAVGKDHGVYVSDSGMKQGAADFEPTGSDAVWVVHGKKAKAVFASKDLNRPNGLFFSGKDLWVATFGAAELYKLSAKGGKQDVLTLPNGGLDGLFVAADGTIWVSSWGAQTIYRGKAGGTFEAAITGVPGPADFAVDTKRNRLVVPRFMDGTVDIFEIH